MRFLLSKIAEFNRDEGGAFAVIFGLLSVVLIAMGGASVDYVMAVGERKQMQVALDSAVLAGIAVLNPKSNSTFIENEVKTAFNAQYVPRFGDRTKVTIKVVVDIKNSTIDATAVASTKTTFVKLVGVNTIDVGAESSSIGGQLEVIVDIAMCIDATGSMRNILEAVKRNALSFDQNLKAEAVKRDRQIDKINVRPIYYRDFDTEGVNYRWYDWYRNRYGDEWFAMRSAGFFSLPNQRQNFQNFVNPRRPLGGGDWPEAGMECFYEAMKSTWTKPTTSHQFVYPIVAIWTDAAADSPGNTLNIQNGGHEYPAGMPRSFSGLKSVWEDSNVIDQGNKVAVLFGPRTSNGWRQVLQWDKVDYGGTVRDGSNNFVGSLADAIFRRMPPPRLSK